MRVSNLSSCVNLLNELIESQGSDESFAKADLTDNELVNDQKYDADSIPDSMTAVAMMEHQKPYIH